MFYKRVLLVAALVLCFASICSAGSKKYTSRIVGIKLPHDNSQIISSAAKGEYSISGHLENMVIGPVLYSEYYIKAGDVRLELYQKRMNGSWQRVRDTDMNEIKKIREGKSEPEKKRLFSKGYFEFSGLPVGKYKILFKTKSVNMLGHDTRLLFDDSEYFVRIIDRDVKDIRFSIPMSTSGKVFYYSLVCLGFMIFFIGISLIVIQRVAFKDIRFLSSFGTATVFLTWSVVLVKIPPRTSLPVFLVQLLIFAVIYLKKDFSDLPLPFLTRTFIQSKEDYLYSTAVTLTNISDDSTASLRFQDKWHNLLTLKGTCFEGEGPFGPDTEVHLIEYDSERDIFYVQSSEQVTGAA